jgi:two-component system, response regulator
MIPEANAVLLVEDNANDARMTLYALRKINVGNPIHVVHDGAEALDFLFGRGRYAGRDLRQPLKLILLDLKLPKVDGLQVLREIKKDELTRLIPVLVMTTSSDEHDIREGYALGANGYVVKPIDFDQWAEALRAVGGLWLGLNKTAD